jgi:hypothetical protein
MFESAVGLSTGVFSSAWNPKDLEATHAEARRQMQIAYSLAATFNEAEEIATELGRIGDKIAITSKNMKMKGEKLQQFIASHKLGKND